MLLVGLAIAGLVTTGSTFAAFSDWSKLKNNEASAGTVTFGGAGASGPDLEFQDLVPGEPLAQQFQVDYSGSVPADLGLAFSSKGPDVHCVTSPEGTTPLSGGAVEVSVNDGHWLDLCSLLGSDTPLPLDRVDPSGELTVNLAMRLRPGTDEHYDRTEDISALTVTAEQTISPGGFTDYATGTVSVATGMILPPIPAECGDPSKYGTPPTRSDAVVWGTVDDDYIVMENGNHPHIVMGLRGDDVLIGGNSGDCLVGSYGNDRLTGGNAKDILMGGPGDDFLDGGRAKDKLNGQDNRDVCYGGLGKDELVNCVPEGSMLQEPLRTESTEPAPAPTDEKTPDPGDQADRGGETEGGQDGEDTVDPSPSPPPTPSEDDGNKPPPAPQESPAPDKPDESDRPSPDSPSGESPDDDTGQDPAAEDGQP